MKYTITSLSRFTSKNQLMFAVVASVTLGASSVPADAVVIAVPNFSFESPSKIDGGYEEVATGWTVSSVSSFAYGVYNPLDAQFLGSTGGDLPAPALGQQTGYLGDGANTGSSSFTTTAPLTSILASSTYTLTVALGSRLDLPTNLTDSAHLAFLANDVVLAEGGLIFNLGESIIPAGTFVDFTTSFTSNSSSPLIGQDLKVRITYNGGQQLMVDNVRMSMVPEPNTTILLAFALPLLWHRRRP